MGLLPCVSYVRCTDSFCLGLSFQRCLYSAQPWKIEIVSLGQRIDLFTAQYNKDIITLWGKNWTGLLIILYKKLCSLSLVFSAMVPNLLCVQHPPGSPSALAPWDFRGRGNQHEGHAVWCDLNSKVLSLWLMSLLTSVSTYETVVG